jgi:MoaA/NifB/PqqE/SkfB family radical SAM enzyme
MRTSVGTIGTLLARPDFARQAAPLLNEALFSLHGPTAAIHDALAGRAGSFDQVCAAITLCQEASSDFAAFVNTVLTRRNLDCLPETVALASRLGAQLIVVSNTTPEGGGLDNFEDLAPSLEQLAELLPRVAEHAGNSVIRFFGVPMCLLGPSATRSNDLHWDPRVTVEWAAEPGKVVLSDLYNWAPDRRRVHVAECEGCEASSICMGVFDRYAELWPTSALRPVKSAGWDQAQTHVKKQESGIAR